MASGKLISAPKTRPINQPGQPGKCTHPMTKPIAKRLVNAPSKAVVLSGKDIGNIKPTSRAPKIIPQIAPSRTLDMESFYQMRASAAISRAKVVADNLSDLLSSRFLTGPKIASNFDSEIRWICFLDLADHANEHQQLITGMIRLHILHHAARQSVYGHWMIEELHRHGYRVSAGTVYPLLHGLQRQGYLTAKSERARGRSRRMYRATTKGRRALEQTKGKIRELSKELIKEL